MRNTLIIIALILATGLGAQAADSLHFSLPLPMDPVFDYFGLSYMGSKGLGRGHSVVSFTGGEEAILANPAAYKAASSNIYLELLVKPPSKTNIYQKGSDFSAPLPISTVALGGELLPMFTWGAAYSLPKVIRLNSMDIPLNQSKEFRGRHPLSGSGQNTSNLAFGAANPNLGTNVHSRYPLYCLHQATGNLAFHLGPLNLGLNLHGQFHYIDDLPVLRSFASIRKTKFMLRPQAGFLYDKANWGVGATYMPQASLDWDMDVISYESKLPALATLGARYQGGKHGVSAQADWENTSIVHSDYKDRITLKAGYETTSRKGTTYRLGYIYHPGIYSGFYTIPTVTTAFADTSIWWQDVPTGGKIPKNDQHFLTVGLGKNTKYVNFNLAFAYQIIGAEPMSQVSLSAGINPEIFKRKKPHPAE